MQKKELVESAGRDFGAFIASTAWVPDEVIAAYIVEHDPAEAAYVAEAFLVADDLVHVHVATGGGDGKVTVRRISLDQVREVVGTWSLDEQPLQFEIKVAEGAETIKLPIKATDVRATPEKASEFVSAVLERLRSGK